jgi:retinol dehydrogenase 12
VTFVKKVLITGGSSGIGKITASTLAKLGHEVIMVARDPHKGRALVDAIKAEKPDAKVEFFSVDISNFSDVKAFAAVVREKWPSLDILILNAGLFTPQLTTSKSGHEFMFATTHLGHFLLTHELMPLLKNATASRVVVTSSVAHHFGALTDFFNFKTISNKGTFMLLPFLSYGRSKLANLLFVRELARRVEGTGIKVNAFHPGPVKTDIWRSTPGLFNAVISPFLISETKGAQTQVFLAIDPAVQQSGQYWARKKIDFSSASSKNLTLAKQLWEYSENVFSIKAFGHPS